MIPVLDPMQTPGTGDSNYAAGADRGAAAAPDSAGTGDFEAVLDGVAAPGARFDGGNSRQGGGKQLPPPAGPSSTGPAAGDATVPATGDFLTLGGGIPVAAGIRTGDAPDSSPGTDDGTRGGVLWGQALAGSGLSVNPVRDGLFPGETHPRQRLVGGAAAQALAGSVPPQAGPMAAAARPQSGAVIPGDAGGNTWPAALSPAATVASDAAVPQQAGSAPAADVGVEAATGPGAQDSDAKAAANPAQAATGAAPVSAGDAQNRAGQPITVLPTDFSRGEPAPGTVNTAANAQPSAATTTATTAAKTATSAAETTRPELAIRDNASGLNPGAAAGRDAAVAESLLHAGNSEGNSPRAPAAATVAPATTGFPTGLATATAARTEHGASFTIPLGHQQWGEELAGRVNLLVRNGLNEASLQLTPPDLGRLDIRISTDGDKAMVLFNVQSGAAREAIEAAMPRLREMLEQSGLQLAQGEVSDQSQSQRGQHGDTHEQFAGIPTGQAGDSDQQGADTAIDAGLALSTSLVDYYI